MLPNEEFALACRAYYEEQGLVVDSTNGEFAHCPYPKGMGEKGYYLLHEHHQHQGLLQSRDLDKKCFFSGDAKRWLLSADYFPDDFFGLWDTYDEFVSKVENNFQTPEARRKRVESRRKNGTLTKGLHTPEVIRKSANSHRKAVEITFPNGRVGVYHSGVVFATLAIGVSPATLIKWLKGAKGKNGDLKGYSARYL